MIIRLSKVGLVSIIALFFTLVAFNNTSDYATNEVFVKHVLSMDTVFADSNTSWRAITSVQIQTLFYWVIIAWESLAAIVCWFAAAKLFAARYDAILFKQRKSLAFFGLSLGFGMYALVFLAVGAEWFQMWQSAQWNGVPSATNFLCMIGFTLLILMTADE
jgi:predicted small integral membrane protein